MNDLKIIFNPSHYKCGVEYDIPFSLTEEEKKYFSNLISIESLSVSLIMHGASSLYNIELFVDGEVTLLDSHILKPVPYSFSDSVEVVISEKEEESDIPLDENKEYDLRGSILALIFSCIPDNYSTVELTKIVTDDYTLYSEEEYLKEKQRRNNPFSDIKIDE